MTASLLSSAARPAAARRPALAAFLGTWRQRRALARLDDRMLADIGVSTDEAKREAARPIWDAPSNWTR